MKNIGKEPRVKQWKIRGENKKLFTKKVIDTEGWNKNGIKTKCGKKQQRVLKGLLRKSLPRVVVVFQKIIKHGGGHKEYKK